MPLAWIIRQPLPEKIALLTSDGSQYPDMPMGTPGWVTSVMPGRWRQDPISLFPLVIGPHWGECKPFVMDSAAQFRVLPPPAMNSAEYAAAFNETKRLGG